MVRTVFEKSSRKKLVKGYADGTFRGIQDITREEVLAMVLRSAQIDTSQAEEIFAFDVRQNEWYAPYVNYGVEQDLIEPVNSLWYGVGKTMTRGEMAKVIVDVYGFGE